MKGGVILFRGSGADARRYLESNRSRADEYYLEGGSALAEFSVVNGSGEVVGVGALTPEEYAGWVDWINPFTNESMGTPREAGDGRQGSPRFAEMVVNAPKSLSIAAALHPEVSAVLDVAQKDAVAEISRWLGEQSVTRVGPRGRQEVVPVEQLETVSVVHKTSRAGDPHRHIHFQIGTRVWAAGAWRGLDTAALFKQQGAVRALGTAVIAAHPQLAAVLDLHGLTLDPVTGEVAELEPFNARMSKRGEQVTKNLARMQAEWKAAHPGQEPGPVVASRLMALAWGHERPNKKPSSLKDEAGWRTELEQVGYAPNLSRVYRRPPVSLDDLRVQEVASRALNRCASAASTWSRHTVQEHVTHITTEAGVRATPEALREFITLTTKLAAADCLSVLPPGTVHPDHVAHLTSLHVVKVETELRDLLEARISHQEPNLPDVSRLGREHNLDWGQTRAAAAVASPDPLVVVEGAAGAGKTTMLGVAIQAATGEGRAIRIVTPTKRAADAAQQELGVSADSVAKLVHAHGWRWDRDGVWTRLAPGALDPETGTPYDGPPAEARLRVGERIVVDEAGMLDQDTALALLTIAAEAGATLALVGDRAQLPAVGRGGVLDMAAHLVGRSYDMATVHRFSDPEYAEFTVRLRAGENPALLFDRLRSLDLIALHVSTERAHQAIATTPEGCAITVATNDEARELNEHIRQQRVSRGDVDDTRTATGSDGLSIGVGDVIQTRKNDAQLGVANRQSWIVQHVEEDGTVWATEQADGHKHQRTVTFSADYVAEHTHLSYASTAYGVQGTTVQESHTLLGDALSAAGAYVGMTRGRAMNQLHIVAADLDEARDQFTAALDRDPADRGLAEASRAAEAAVRGLTDDGPAKLVNRQRARLAAQIEHADRQAQTWGQAAVALDQQRQTHRAEQEKQQAVVAAAHAHAEQVSTDITTPLIAQATEDGTAYVAVQARMWEASTASRGAGRLSRRATQRILAGAAEEHRAVEAVVRKRWGNLPLSRTDVHMWAQAAAQAQAAAHPWVIEARQEVERARTKQAHLIRRHFDERAQLRQRVLGQLPPGTVGARAAEWRELADQARRQLAEIQTLPVGQAARLVRKRAERAARSVEQSRNPWQPSPPRPAPDDGQRLGL